MHSLDLIQVVQDFTLYVLVVVPIVALRVFVEPFHQGFFCDDQTIRYPFKENTISELVLMVGGISIPAIAIFCVETYRFLFLDSTNDRRSKSWARSTTAGVYVAGRLVHPMIIRLLAFLCPFMYGAALCDAINDAAKTLVGSLRPHFVDVCAPDWSRINCTPGQYIKDIPCTTDDVHRLREARQSFPSGHASFFGYAVIFACFYLKCRWSWSLGPSTSRLFRPTVHFALLASALMVGFTRISDFHHRWPDVIGGWVIGTVTALAIVNGFDCFEPEPPARNEQLKRCSRSETSSLLSSD